ncbi:hypothetical protein EAI77_01155 [Ligilactobacillus ruminis]|nr:hypothetical protein EAI77_01155 [Ligilactobacillus ruminis]
MATYICSEIMIVFAGYTKEMEQFLKTNPVLKSRVPNEFDFEDYTPEEAVEIGLKYLESQQCRFNDGSLQAQQGAGRKVFRCCRSFGQD